MNEMDARRIVCGRGHLFAVLKTEPETGDEFATAFIDRHHGTCMYCGDALRHERAPLHEFNVWISREDRYYTNGAPT